ncbi:MAG: acetyl-CoA C-acetyltransferase [Ilumatobacteraceae bacterium]|nr:acetyl-CoA C-acetyltransferase [Ilumatobacteraceae bacterium]
MSEAFIVEAVRSPVGRRGGGLSQVHPADLGAHSIRALMERSGVDPHAVDDVVFGCLDTIGPQAGDIARTCGLVGGLPEHVPGVTVDRQCGSAQQSVHFAAQAVMSGTMDVVVAGGVQNMSQVPITSSFTLGQEEGFNPYNSSPGWQTIYGAGDVSQFVGAELMVDKWDITRDEMEAFAVESHERALRAQAEGRFDNEIVPLAGVERDEGPREPDWDKIRSLKTLTPDGRITAAVASQISDGSAAMLIMNERAVEAHGVTPRARIHHMSVLADDPIMMLSAPIPATLRALAKTGLKPSDIDLVEINEAFAPVPLAWMRETGFEHEQINVNGGAIALGHPLGATGARLMITLLNELERTGGRYGLQTMCEGGGQANVTIIERL